MLSQKRQIIGIKWKREELERLQKQRENLRRLIVSLEQVPTLEANAAVKFKIKQEIQKQESILEEIEKKIEKEFEELEELEQVLVVEDPSIDKYNQYVLEDIGSSTETRSSELIRTIASNTQTINSLAEVTAFFSIEEVLLLKSEEFEGSKLGFILSQLKEIKNLLKDYDRASNQAQKNNQLLQLMVAFRKLKDTPLIQGEWYSENVQAFAKHCLELVENEVTDEKAADFYQPIPNPFIYGKPVHFRDAEVFVGRTDIVQLIEQEMLKDPRPTLFLYGRRRTGKTSALLHLNRFIGWLVVSIYVDLQDVRFRESSSAFCRNLTRTISREIPQLEECWQQLDFDRNPFTALDEFLEAAEDFVTERKKLILLAFDEYERLRTKHRDILDTLRSIAQHRRQIVVLVAGSHRFAEVKTVSWSDYLINTQTIEISYLDAASARKLITKPTESFDLEYPSGMPETILELTHCQPYLLQAVAHELVNHLNFQQRKTATADDLDLVRKKVLTAAEAYFTHLWSDECNDDERLLLEDLTVGPDHTVVFEPRDRTLRSLLQKEILMRKDSTVQIAVPLFQQWIREKQLLIEPN